MSGIPAQSRGPKAPWEVSPGLANSPFASQRKVDPPAQSSKSPCRDTGIIILPSLRIGASLPPPSSASSFLFGRGVSPVKKFRNKPFPLFNYLSALYEGNTATGDLNFVSIEQVEPSTDQVIPNDNDAHDVDLNPFSTNLKGQATSSAHIEADEVECAPSTSSGQKGDDNGQKEKVESNCRVLESYLEFKKEQTKKIAEELNETTRHGQNDDFSIGKCVAALESIEDLADMEKAKALRLFKCELNREIFINTKNPSVLLLWIKSEIAPSAFGIYVLLFVGSEI